MNKSQSDVFAAEEADRYFDRNTYTRGFIADYLISLFTKEHLSSFNLAEFGIGGGQNLLLFKNYVRSVHGFDASEKAIACYKQFFSSRPDAVDFQATTVNLCKPFTVSETFNLIMYGFFAYYVTNDELAVVKQNALSCLDKEGYIFIHDFLVRDSSCTPDKRNPNLNVYKRDLTFWISHMSGFDLVDFRLFDEQKNHTDKLRDEFCTIDATIPQNDSYWTFGALFRRSL